MVMSSTASVVPSVSPAMSTTVAERKGMRLPRNVRRPPLVRAMKHTS